MKTKKGNTAIIAVIIVIVAITAGLIGWLFARQSQAPAVGPQQAVATQPAQTQNAVQPAASQAASAVTPQNKIDETTSWQTYTNMERGYELKYPLGYMPDSPVEQYGTENVYFLGKDNTRFDVTVKYEFGRQTIDLTPDPKYIKSGPVETKIGNAENIGKKYIYGDSSFWNHIIVEKNNKVYAISTGNAPTGTSLSEDVFNKILSTFTLLSSSENQNVVNSVPVTYWNPYKNVKNDFSFEYPDGWQIADKYNNLGYADGIILKSSNADEMFKVTIKPIVYKTAKQAFNDQILPGLSKADHKVTSIQFNRYSAISYSDANSQNIVLAGSNNVLVLTYSLDNKNDSNLKQVLSSFKLSK